jgi:Ser/Thr protein kinase RdoA (MazF antagonist)
MIDFGDSQFNPLIYELALSIMYLMTNCTEINPNLVIV